MNTKKYHTAIAKLTQKISLSITPVPGFVVGLSGTDSILAFDILYRALENHDMANKLVGVHYASELRKKSTWFEETIIPWMRERYSKADIRVVGLIDNCEISRFSAIQYVSKGEGLWTAWPVNVTEARLGKYTILAHAASIWPIKNFWKSEILALCEHLLRVPNLALEMSRLPDCLCGRDELAAENIELIDDLLRSNPIDFEKHGIEKIQTLMAWIKDQKAEFGFKERTPYTL